MKKTALSVLSAIVLNTIFLQMALAQQKSIAQKVDSVLNLMTLDEKVGQLNQYNDDWTATGPMTIDTNKARQIQSGKVGA